MFGYLLWILPLNTKVKFIPQLSWRWSGEQHYHDFIQIFGRGADLSTYFARDHEKKQQCSQEGIQLVQIPYWWDLSLSSLVEILDLEACLTPCPLKKLPSSWWSPVLLTYLFSKTLAVHLYARSFPRPFPPCLRIDCSTRVSVFVEDRHKQHPKGYRLDPPCEGLHDKDFRFCGSWSFLSSSSPNNCLRSQCKHFRHRVSSHFALFTLRNVNPPLVGVLDAFSRAFKTNELPVYGRYATLLLRSDGSQSLLSFTAYDNQLYTLQGLDEDVPFLGHVLSVDLTSSQMKHLFKCVWKSQM